MDFWLGIKLSKAPKNILEHPKFKTPVARYTSDMGPIYRDIVVGPKYRPFSDISLCICCVFDRTFPEDIVVVSFMT